MRNCLVCVLGTLLLGCGTRTSLNFGSTYGWDGGSDPDGDVRVTWPDGDLGAIPDRTDWRRPHDTRPPVYKDVGPVGPFCSGGAKAVVNGATLTQLSVQGETVWNWDWPYYNGVALHFIGVDAQKRKVEVVAELEWRDDTVDKHQVGQFDLWDWPNSWPKGWGFGAHYYPCSPRSACAFSDWDGLAVDTASVAANPRYGNLEGTLTVGAVGGQRISVATCFTWKETALHQGNLRTLQLYSPPVVIP